MSLSQNIKRLRHERGLTQEQLAGLLGVSAQAVSKWETSETYPDGALLTPLANALDVSLDTLFDNQAYSMKDIAERIRKMLIDTPNDKAFHAARDICWQIEKGLFYRRAFMDDEGYDADEINTKKLSSYVLNDYGFTHASNGRAPFFSVFPEYENGFSDVIGDGEEMRKVFEALALPETMRAVIFLHKNTENYVFEKEVLSAACEIAPERLDGVIKSLLELRLVSAKEMEINGKMCTLYFAQPSHKIIALFLFTHELNYAGAYCYQAQCRSKPYLK